MKVFNQKVQRMGYWVTVLVALLLVFGCEKNGSSPQMEKLQLSEESQAGLSSTWEAHHSLNSVKEMASIMNGDLIGEDDDVELMSTTAQVKAEFGKMKKNVVEMAKANRVQNNMSGDSLIFFVDYTDPVSGVSVR
ncbi:MAG: hypothetical protein GWN16_16500, partial [Calditrichae bacterium]|nr:hypothetical protein [Calditrichia bacterium]